MLWSKSWDTSVTAKVSYESFWAVVTLLFFWIVFCSSWTSNTVSAVPEWEVGWAIAFFIHFVEYSSVSFLISRAFTNVVGVQFSWEFTWDFTVTLLCEVVEWMIEWTWFASLVNSIEDVWSIALNTVVANLNKSLFAACFNLIIIPAWVWWWNCLCGLRDSK